jgi:hypothetical protein
LDKQSHLFIQKKTIELLWTNSSPYADWAHNKKISLDLTEYCGVLITLGEYMGDSWRRDNLTSWFCVKGQRNIVPAWFLTSDYKSNYNVVRAATVDNTGITLTQGGNASNNYTNHVVPRFVYGVRENIF